MKKNESVAVLPKRTPVLPKIELTNIHQDDKQETKS
jgi:hypothetical protein